MKKLYLLLFCLITSISFSQDLLISGVIDGPLPEGFPKGIELYVVNNIPDLSIYGLERAANGAASTGTQSFTFPADSYNAGDFIYVGTTHADAPAAFLQYLSITLTYQNGAVNHNGNDAILLYKNGAVSDSYGEAGVNGTGTAWESLDGWAYRNTGTGPNASFTSSEWTFSGVGALVGCNLADNSGTNSDCDSMFPTSTYSSATASIQENNIDGFSMYPNPVSDGILRINTLENSEKTIQIFDVLGKQVLLRTTKSEHISLAKLNSGIYILKVTELGKTATRKLVIK